MLPDPTISRIIRKEMTLFFSSPVAYLFLASFAAITLFIFFWGETFFARNISDVRPLFEWMPLLLIFLTSTLTMRMWSEERRSGTLEHILTQSIGIWPFVAGKFIACLILLLFAMIITLPLPITVAWIAELDWGPVWSGYLATLLLGAAYLSIGLYISARSDNQIVSLISAITVCGVFYLPGTPVITDFVGNQMGEWLRLLGSGSRFEDITRGVIDLRDFAYYLSITTIFLSLNIFTLERQRWANSGQRKQHRNWIFATSLLIANAIAINIWLGQIHLLRLDTTQSRLYSISDTTTGYLGRLQEPMLIRGYFSSKTHPLLSPLIPQIRDLMKEYEVAGKGRVRVEFIDPISKPELEQQANQKYGIKAVPFQIADRHQSAMVNSYFNILIEYGDEFQVLGFQDLIEVKVKGERDLDVQLRNPEYDITRAIKKVLLAYQSGGNLFDTVKGDLNFTAYISSDKKLPKQLVDFKDKVQQELEKFQQQSHGRLKISFVEPEANGGQIAQQIARDYGFQPMIASLFDRQQFYCYLTLSQGEQVVQIPLGDYSSDSFEQAMKSGIKRFASGLTRTVAIVNPNIDPQTAQRGMTAPQFRHLEQILGADLNIKRQDLSSGIVDSEIDLLMLAAPESLDKKQLFAVDQFLMRGGTVILATSPFKANLSGNGLNMQRHNSGLDQWLQHHGLKVEEKLVMDSQNSAFPVPVTRQAGAFRFQEIRMVDYPYFADLRSDELNQNNPVTSGLNQLTMTWSSPITIDEQKNSQRNIIKLLHSSDHAWLSDSLDITPKIDSSGQSLFIPVGDQGRQLLGLISQGKFNSYFADQESPLLSNEESGDNDDNKEGEKEVISSVIEHSPESARIILFSSNDFLSDQVTQMIGAQNRSQYLNNLQLLANSVDWSFEEKGLLNIRSRAHFNRTLPPMEKQEQLYWEIGNYAMAILMLLLLAITQTYRRRQRENRYAETLIV